MSKGKKFIRIASVQVREDQVEKLGYENIFDRAMQHEDYRHKHDRKKLIDKELRKHGLRPKSVTGRKGNKPAPNDGGGDTEKK